jgi:hypothetical protein
MIDTNTNQHLIQLPQFIELSILYRHRFGYQESDVIHWAQYWIFGSFTIQNIWIFGNLPGLHDTS